jgi:hypothetical protein
VSAGLVNGPVARIDAQGAVGQGAAHAVATHQFGQMVGDVRRRLPFGAHLEEAYLVSSLGDLPGRFGAGQPTAYNRHLFLLHRSLLKKVISKKRRAAALQKSLPVGWVAFILAKRC